MSNSIQNRDFVTIGKKAANIDVKISYRIIQLFSEGLYSSPNKAIEELVSNAFDAGATKVHILISPDLAHEDATIAVLDNGIGMDEQGLQQHWLIGVSNKRMANFKPPAGRKQIGKFGIGKLATYVLAEHLTHISKVGKKYYATSMDFRKIPSGEKGGIHTEKAVTLPLRILTEHDAKIALAPWINGSKPGFKELKLFGTTAIKNWTCAILSGLKPMATEIRLGSLKWILKTALPLRDHFKLFLNGDPVPPSKLKEKRIGQWQVGRELVDLPKPAPDDLQVTKDERVDVDPREQWGLTHRKLGRITGYAELYEDLLTAGKSADIERSHGFFVYVLDRLINLDDEYFGIDSNLLRHGTFSRFRMVVHIDKLDEELRSSREDIRKSELFYIARNFLHGAFNFVRAKSEEHEKATDPSLRIGNRIAASPKSLTLRPVIGLLQAALNGTYYPKFLEFPRGLSPAASNKFLKQFKASTDSEQLVKCTLITDLAFDAVVAKFDVTTRTLLINGLHPFVAYFRDAYQDQKRNLPA